MDLYPLTPRFSAPPLVWIQNSRALARALYVRVKICCPPFYLDAAATRFSILVQILHLSWGLGLFWARASSLLLPFWSGDWVLGSWLRAASLSTCCVAHAASHVSLRSLPSLTPPVDQAAVPHHLGPDIVQLLFLASASPSLCPRKLPPSTFHRRIDLCIKVGVHPRFVLSLKRASVQLDIGHLPTARLHLDNCRYVLSSVISVVFL
jgi:hypothetical protein